jgi:hypothetical protein
MEKHELKEILQNGVATVVFTKTNGDIREMNCTLLSEYIPEQPKSDEKQLLTESVQKRKENNEVLSVWDLDKSAWRSFRLDSISGVTPKA